MHQFLYHRKMSPGVLLASYLILFTQISYGEIPQQLTPQIVLQEGLSDVLSVRFAPSGKELAAVDSNGRIILWDIKQQKMIGNFQLPGTIDSQPEGLPPRARLEWDAEGNKLVCWAHDVGAVVIDRHLMKQTTLFSESKGLQNTSPYRYRSTRSLRFSTDGKSLLRLQFAVPDVFDEMKASGLAPSNLEVIHLETRNVLVLDAPRFIMSLAYFKNGQFLATDLDATLFSGNAENGSQKTRVVRKTERKRQELYDNLTIFSRGKLDISADEKYAVMSGVSGEFKYDKSGKEQNSISGVVDVFQLNPLKKLNSLPITKFNFQALRISVQRSSYLFSGRFLNDESSKEKDSDSGVVDAYQFKPRKKTQTRPDTKIDNEDQNVSNFLSQLKTVCISPDGSYIAAGSLSGIVQIWNRQNLQTVRVIKLDNLEYIETARGIRFAPGEQPICSFIAGHKNFYLFDLTKKQIFKLSVVNTFDWSADGKQLAVGGREDGSVLIFNMTN